MVRVYPNPTDNILNIELVNCSEGEYSFEIYNLLGQKVMSIPFNANSKSVISTSELNKGTYIYKVQGDNTLMGMGKFTLI